MRHPATRPQPRQRGAALLLALVILTLVSTVTAGMVWQQTRAVDTESAERARAQAGWILNGALDWARLILREDQRSARQRGNAYTSLDDAWSKPLEEARLSSFLAADKDNNADSGIEAFISGAIVDNQARLNIRGLVDPAGKVVKQQVDALQRVASLAGAPSDTATRIAQAFSAVTTPPTEPDARGTPLRPETLEDLAWLGIEPATLARLADWVTLLPVITSVNANTAPREVLMGAIDGLDLGSAERLVQARGRKPFANLDAVQALLPADVKAEPARVGVSSNWFEVSGRLRLEERVLEERSLLQREGEKVTVRRRERHSFTMVQR
jgi:general secretion pathway protein K